MNDLQIFSNSEFGNIRTVTIDGEPWFVGKDIAEALGYEKPTDAVRKRVDDEDRGISKMETPSGIQNMTVINESGLYSLILSSKLPNAKKFKRWVTSEVLPAIRKRGHYEAPGYAPKATSVGEVVNLIKITRQTMKEQGASPTEIAQAVKEICEQFGVNLPQCFIKPKETTMTDVMQMIDFIYAQPRGKGHKAPTYDDFIIYQASVKRLGG
jgi:prophage antirepressor-like protein